jgi:hypothetical protein
MDLSIGILFLFVAIFCAVCFGSALESKSNAAAIIFAILAPIFGLLSMLGLYQFGFICGERTGTPAVISQLVQGETYLVLGAPVESTDGYLCWLEGQHGKAVAVSLKEKPASSHLVCGKSDAEEIILLPIEQDKKAGKSVSIPNPLPVKPTEQSSEKPAK